MENIIVAISQSLQHPVPTWALLLVLIAYVADRFVTAWFPIIRKVRSETRREKNREEERREVNDAEIAREQNLRAQRRRLAEHNKNIPPPL